MNTKMKDVLIWGGGNRTTEYMKRNMFSGINILAIIDSYSTEKKFWGYEVIRPEEIVKYQTYDYIIVNNRFYEEIVKKLMELHIPLEKIITTDPVREEPFRTYFERAKDVIPMIYEIARPLLYRTVRANGRDLSDDATIYSNDQFKDREYNTGYFRYRTFEFVAEEIEKGGIQGELAELGVFRGLFSAVINYRFPDRKLYLFDTFEGFEPQEAQKEYEQGRCSLRFIESHKDTSIEQMLSNIPFSEKVKICKGFFPQSVTGDAEKEKYAFVSLDVDFEESTYEGLKFFYPRLSEGGYIFIHDYNTYFLDGIKAAVKKYEDDMGARLKKVPIADSAGTLIIVK